MLDLGLGLWRRTSAGLIAFDSFNRANDALSLGTSDSEHVWTALTGTWGINNNQATSSGNGAFAVIDSGISDGVVRVTFTVVSGSSLGYRVQDATNGLYVNAGAGYAIYKLNAGAGSFPAADATVPANGDVVEVRMSGSAALVYVNGVLRISYSDAFLASATKQGLGNVGGTNTARWDGFSVRAT